MSQASKEHIFYNSSVFPRDIDTLFPILASIYKHPLFLPAEIEETRESLGYELSQLERNFQAVLSEKFQSVAFSNTTLGSPSICPEESLSLMTPELLHQFKSTWYTPDRLILAGIGLEPARLVDLAEKHFGDVKPIDKMTESYQDSHSLPAKYSGGVKYISTIDKTLHPDDLPLSHFYLGFESLPVSDPDIYCLLVLNTLLGGGGSFSAGGPGKGMYSRLYRQVLNRYYWIESCNAFHHAYSDSGVFGISASVPVGKEEHRAVISILCDQFHLARQVIDKEELERAKKQLKSQLLMNIESHVPALEETTKHVSHFKSVPDLRELCARIDVIEEEDIKRVVRRVVFNEDVTSRFEYPGMKSAKRTGNGFATLVVQGPFSEKDVVYKSESILKEWGFKTPTSEKKRGLFFK